MDLLTVKQVAALLSVSTRTAQHIIKDVPCLDLGRGRGKGKRWLREDVETFLLSKIKKQPKQGTRNYKSTIASMSSSDFLDLVRQPVIQ